MNRWCQLRLGGGQMGILWMLGGISGVMAIMLLLQHSSSDRQKNHHPHVTQFEVLTPKIAPQTQKSAPMKKAKATKINPLLAPLPSSLGGQNFGLDQFKLDGLQDLSRQIVGTIKNVAMAEDAVDQAPRPKGNFTINYPDWARKQGISGHVTLSLLINQMGLVEIVKKIESEPEGIFDEIAISSVKGLEFEPALYQGQAVRTWVTQKIRFKLN